MNRTWSRRTAMAVGLAGLGAGLLITAFVRADTRRPEASRAADLLGALLPPLTLRAVDGKAVSLTERLSHTGSTLIIVLGAHDCFSCSSYELELRILKSKLPGVTPLLIGSGGDEALFQDYFRKDHLQPVALLDRDRALLTSLGVRSEPLVLLVDSAGRILFVDSRSSSAAAQFPFGRLLPLLGGALQSVPSSPPKSGESN